MEYKDKELTLEELKEVKARIKEGKTNEMLDILSKKELEQLKDAYIKDRELSMDELDNIKAGIPQELIDKEKENNKDIFGNK